MKFVWCYWAGASKGSELLYSMRSVESNFYGEAEIVLVGDCPSWYHGKHIPKSRIPCSCPRHAEKDWYSKILKACYSLGVGEDFVLMKDNTYLLQGITAEDIKEPRSFGIVTRDGVERLSVRSVEKSHKKEAFEAVGKELMHDYSGGLPLCIDPSKFVVMEHTHNLLIDYRNWEIIYGNSNNGDPLPCRPFLERSRIPRRQVSGIRSKINAR